MKMTSYFAGISSFQGRYSSSGTLDILLLSLLLANFMISWTPGIRFCINARQGEGNLYLVTVSHIS
jgi:hypothetical protein